MATLRYQPIATQLSKAVPVTWLLPSDALDQARRDRPPREPDDPELDPDVEEFLLHYGTLARAGFEILQAPPFDRLARLSGAIDEEYMPGGPPMSPVYDSMAGQLVLGDVAHGVSAETPYSVLAHLTRGDSARARLHQLAQSMTDAHRDLYRVLHADGLSADLEPVRGGPSLPVRLTGPFLRTGDFILARVLLFGDTHFVADSPYLLEASEQDWLEYLDRVASARAAVGAPSTAPRGKLTSKQRARAQQRKKLSAAKANPEAMIVQHLKFGDSARFWLDYVVDGYAGERRGIVRLAGVPDRPATLPHHDDYDAPAAAAAARAKIRAQAASQPPIVRVRLQLFDIAKREGLFEAGQQRVAELCTELGCTRTEPDDRHGPLFAAYCTLGAESETGGTALEILEREASLDDEERKVVANLKRGWFTVVRIDRIHLDRGFEGLDVLRRRKVQISERSATRQVSHDDLLVGWLCEDERGTLTLEGGVMHVPSLIAPAMVDLAQAARSRLSRGLGGQGWKRDSGALAPVLLAGLMALRERGPRPKLVNTSGDPLQFATGRYKVVDRARARAVLQETFGKEEDDEYDWLDERQMIQAHFDLEGDKLLVRVNSRARLEKAKAYIERLLGSTIEPSLDSLDGDVDTLLERELASGRPPAAPVDLLPELADAIRASVVEQIRSTLDQPIPAFKHKTLRQLARGKNSRADAITWLREQERILKMNPQMAGLDMRSLWQELGLDYQGLDTDPRR